MFDKPTQLIPLNQESIKEQTLYHARQAFSASGDQSPSLSFSLYWLQLVRESYRTGASVHPKSKIKRKVYMEKVFPYGISIYRNPSRFLRWYMERNHGSNIGDPTGEYYVPLSSRDEDLSQVPHPTPNMLGDNFTVKLFRYYKKLPKVRLTRPATNYGFVKLHVPPYVSLEKFEGQIGWKKQGGTQISGYLDDEILRQTIRSEIGLYIRQFKDCMDTRYLNFLNEQLGLNE